MKVSLKWLRDYVDIDLTPEELADRLTMAGLEVDAIEESGPAFDGVVTARILSARPHPEAEKLHLCEVTDGRKTYPIVCGAPNTRVGDIVALARVGASIPGGYVIKSSRLRGELSEGMLCSEDELGIGEDASGILILPVDTPLGLDLRDVLGLKDTVLDIGVTPNRADCLSILGVAREIAALTGRSLRRPSIDVIENEEDIRTLTSVTIHDPDLCPRYAARMIRNVTIGPSPRWMRERLESVGLRSINNIVDVTNFVMMEMGQPLHAFDFRYLEEGRIVVRRSREGEHFISLDEKDRTLKGDSLMICDGAKPVAIAGIMGGLNSEVKDDTTTIFLESAYFYPASIRKSARWLAMGTDASFRFERGVDPEGILSALNRAARLMIELGGGISCRGAIDEYPGNIPMARDIPLRPDRVNEVLGTAIDPVEMVRILESLEMTVVSDRKEEWCVTPPTFRVDIGREIDLVEEIARLYGYGKIPVTMPRATGLPQAKTPRQVLEERLRGMLTGSGFTEVITYSFVPSAFPSLLGLKTEAEATRLVKIRNPLTEDQGVMRTTLAYSLLDVLGRNSRSGIFDLRIFETGRVYYAAETGCLPEEKNRLACLMAGSRSGLSWHLPACEGEADFFDLKGIVENLLSALDLSDCRFVSDASQPFLHPGRSCRIENGSRLLGFLGEVHPQVLETLDIRGRAVFCEIDMDLVLAARQEVRKVFREVPKYPASSRDVAFVVSTDIPSQRLLDAAYGRREELLEKADIFDVYTGTRLPEGTRSLGLRFSYRSRERTLTDDAVNEAHQRIVKAIIEETQARIRG